MMKIEFAPVTSFKSVENVASLLEVLALARGYCVSDDVAVDLDTLAGELNADPEAFGLSIEESDFLIEEPFAARQLASVKLAFQIHYELEQREICFGKGYPFIVELAAGVVSLKVKPCEDIHPAAVAALWVRFFCLVNDKDFAQIDKDKLFWFNKQFEDLFEVISVYSVSGRVEGAAWWAGRSRGHIRFLEQLNFLRDFLGSGLVRTANQLQPNQIGVNDGGVDGMVVYTVDGVVTPAVECYLVGATIQRSSLRNKIVGADQITRFRDFFIDAPNTPFRGVLTLPHAHSDALHADCSARNCVYMPLPELLSHLGVVARRPMPNALAAMQTVLAETIYSLSKPIIDKIGFSERGNEFGFQEYECLTN